MRIDLFKSCLVLIMAILLNACASSQPSLTAGQATIEYNLLYTLPEEPLSFNNDVLPILEKRCIACHGCYDAPCQLKLTSAEGIKRGANKRKVYNGTRIIADQPTRLFIDATNAAEWRAKDFTPILHEATVEHQNSPAENLRNSVLYRMLRLKQLHPQARTGMLDDNFDLSLDREQSCPTINEFPDYADKHPNGGMPFAMPNLPRKEYNTLVHWIAQGSPMEDDLPPSKETISRIEQWEILLNGDSKKEKLFSRYIYEHLFQAHIHFKGSDEREFYRLVRSTTPPGEKIEVIPTRRPYGNVNGRVYYRLIRHQGGIVAKTHNVYEFSSQRMQRYRELFLDADYKITTLPSYAPHIASNPIKAFADIPVNSRYRFLLDDARFFIEGFIKGPVCRGQVALNVIEDQFWVAFLDPDAPIASSSDEFLKANADNMALPTELEDTFRFFSVNLHYKGLFKNYIGERFKGVNDTEAIDLSKALKYIWNGDDNTNPNAALTVFRHLDSASVNNGWLGDYPETAWLIDYTILERIHYLLVAGFDVYGNAGHQLHTRLYMDLLRSEAENYFLALLPAKKRRQLMDDWYQGIRKSDKYNTNVVQWLDKDLVNGYKTDDEQRELYHAISGRLGPLVGDGDFINRCTDNKCKQVNNANILRADKAMRLATHINGRIAQYSPDVAFVRVLMGGEPEDDRAYSIIYNKAYKSVSNMMQTEKLGDPRDYEYDTQTILPWLEGSYPDFFYVIKLDEIETFVENYKNISNRADYESFIMHYGLRRTNEDFWLHADWFNEQYKRERPVLSGIFDLNRYQNR
jgi:hypothetical protein